MLKRLVIQGYRSFPRFPRQPSFAPVLRSLYFSRAAFSSSDVPPKNESTTLDEETASSPTHSTRNLPSQKSSDRDKEQEQRNLEFHKTRNESLRFIDSKNPNHNYFKLIADTENCVLFLNKLPLTVLEPSIAIFRKNLFGKERANTPAEICDLLQNELKDDLP